MKIKIITTIMLGALLSFPALATSQSSNWTDYGFIAHAMGGINSKNYTNSYDAFVYNYKQGQRVFEVDLETTSDGYVVARHDWGITYAFLEQKDRLIEEGRPLSLKEFKEAKINKIYSPLDINDVLSLLQDYPDAYMITDTKDITKTEVKEKFHKIVEAAKDREFVLDRVIPQLYNQEMLEYIEDVYNFDSYVYTLYQSEDTNEEVINFINKEPKISAITMPEYRAEMEFLRNIKSLKVSSYVHTINDPSTVIKLRRIGVDGFYTDILTEDYLNDYRKTRFSK